MITAVAEGNATITATVAGKSASTQVVVERLPVASVQLDQSAVAVEVGNTADLTATPKDARDRELDRAITWNTSNPTVATVALVNSTGQRVRITGLTQGSATITATSEGKSASALVTVTVPSWILESVTGNPGSAFSDNSGTGSGTLTVNFPSQVALGDAIPVSATYSVTITYAAGFGMTNHKIFVSVCQRVMGSCVFTGGNDKQLGPGAGGGDLTWAGSTSAITNKDLATFSLQATGNFQFQGTISTLVATYRKQQ